MDNVAVFTDIQPVQTKTVPVAVGQTQSSQRQANQEARLVVTCSGGTRFDPPYYVDRHLPLTLAAWKPYGLERAAAFFPSGEHDSTNSVGVYTFRNEQALFGALQSAETEKVMGDVTHFTNAKVNQSLSVPL